MILNLSVMLGPWLKAARRLLIVAVLAPAASSAVHAQSLGPVDRDFFGLVVNRSEPGSAWPEVPFGTWRLWDAYVTWARLEPKRGEWVFGPLDRMVGDAQSNSVKPLLVLAHSPGWASARPDERNAYQPGVAAEPARIEDWRNYVRTVGQRYKGKINEYQVWNEPSDKSHFTGTVANLVELTCEAHRILKAIDPAIRMVSAGSAGGGRHIKYLDDFLAAGGAKCIDVVAHHFYVPRFGPEAMVPLIREVRQVMVKRGVADLPLWNTETGWWIANTDATPDHDIVAKTGWRKLDADTEAGAVIERAFLLARAEGVSRVYWYAWNNPYGWSLTDASGRPKPAVKHWHKAYARMMNSNVISCTSAGSNYSCELQGQGGDRSTVRWTDELALVRREGAAAQLFSVAGVPKP